MINKVSSKDLYHVDNGWRSYRLHFSYADYEDPSRKRFGVLRALNDETLQPANGFEDHPHHEMEIITYCIHGELDHHDSFGNQDTLRPGDVQYTCAGTGINHAEMNVSPDQSMRFLNIWIQPNQPGLTPHYESKHFTETDRHNQLLQIVSGEDGNGALRIHQDANIYVSQMDRGHQLSATLQANRQAYIVCIEGTLAINGVEIMTYEGLEIAGETRLILKAIEDSHLLMVEVEEALPNPHS
jgi:hypothetical protein